jgi:nitrite reductase (NO-forming)
VFRKCQACHSLEPGKNLLGPSLEGIIGRKAGTAPGYSYSPAMQGAKVVRDAKTLDAYLAEPEKVVPGNKMPFPGLKTDQDRADVIAYLASAAATSASAPAPTSPPASPAPASPTGADIGFVPDAKYTLRSGIAEGRMVYIGVGGEIDGKVNPVLTAAEGQVVQLTLINGEGAEHDIVFPGQDARSPRVVGKNASTTIAFRAAKAGDFTYFCSVPGHQLAGMQGQFVVMPRLPAQVLVEADISREPTDLPPPIGKRDPQTIRVDLFLVEPEGGLPPVDREFYVMQGEIYTDAAFGQRGSQEFSVQKLLDERREYFVFNGSVGALTKLHPLRAKVGERVRTAMRYSGF